MQPRVQRRVRLRGRARGAARGSHPDGSKSATEMVTASYSLGSLTGSRSSSLNRGDSSLRTTLVLIAACPCTLAETKASVASPYAFIDGRPSMRYTATKSE